MNSNGLSILNAYQRRIFEYIRDYHPHLMKNKNLLKRMIISRANAADEVYRREVSNGTPSYIASYDANEVLHAGLEFSAISYLKELYEDKKDEIIENKKAIAIYKKTKSIFDIYGAEIEGDEREMEMIERLMPYLK